MASFCQEEALIASLIDVQNSACTVLFWFRNAQLGDKVKEVEQQKKDYQEFVNWGNYMKEKNPNTWKKWESGEVKYTPAPDKQS